MTCHYIPGYGIRVTFYGADYGFNVMLPEDWTVAQIARYLHELMEYYEP